MSSHRSPLVRRSLLAAAAALLSIASLAPRETSAQGRLLVNADEWTLGTAHINSGGRDGDVFARNARNWLAGGTSGGLLAYSSNFGLTGSTLASVMGTDGYTWTQVDPGSAAAAAAWSNRSSYRAIFVGGNAVPSLTELVDYVNGGGSVYLMGGTGLSLPGGEDSYWDAFLGRFGLAYGTSYNNIGGDIVTTGLELQGPFGAALFAGVDQLYQDNGNSVLNAAALPADATRQIFVARQNGLFAAAAIAQSTVPEPSTYLLLGAGLLALGAVARRRRAG